MGTFGPPRQGSGAPICQWSSSYGTLRKPYFLVTPLTIPLVTGPIHPPNGPGSDEKLIPQSGDRNEEIC